MIESGELNFFNTSPVYQKEKLFYKNINKEETVTNLNKVLNIINQIEENNFNKDNIKTLLMELADGSENRGMILHPVRFALSGLDKSPDPFIIADILGKNETIDRLETAVSILEK
jgi:glutamyl/glutaminyl-tRNA synthetase